MKAAVFFVLLGLCVAVRRFDGHSVLRLKTKPEHYNALQVLNSMDRDTANFWSHSDLHVTPESRPDIETFLNQHKIPFEEMIANVQELVDREKGYTAFVRETESAGGRAGVGSTSNDTDPFFDDYRNNTEIGAWLNQIAYNYSNLVELKVINTSYEGRPLRVLRITSKVGFRYKKPAIVWEGGIHAREWITHATMCYMISKLVTNYGVDPVVTKILDTYEWHIAPVVNPDGYAYTWTVDRMWRKTRSKNADSPCRGVDPNRNWDDHWCEIGASPYACSDSYCGPRAFSEVEVWSMANYVMGLINNDQQVLEFIDYHSYGQLYMAPYGWSPAPPPNAAALATLGNMAVASIYSVYGTVFDYGQIYEIIYPASGSSADWGYDEAGIQYTYGIELRDTGEYGFLLPASEIVPQGEEIWASLLTTAQYFMNISSLAIATD